MKTPFSKILLTALVLTLLILAYKVGYYKATEQYAGYSSYLLLANDETIYDDIRANRNDDAEWRLRLEILAARTRLRMINQQPFPYQFDPGTMKVYQKNLDKADEMTKGTVLVTDPRFQTN